MIWVQGTVCLVFWLAFGYWSARKAWAADLPKKPWAGAGLMVGGAAAMFGGMALLAANGGMADGKLTVLGWVSAAILGMVFTGGQSYGSVWIIRSTLGRETGDNGDASKSEDREK